MKVKTMLNMIKDLGVNYNGKEGVQIVKKLKNGAQFTITEAKVKKSATCPYGHGIDEDFKDDLYVWNTSELWKCLENKYEIEDLIVEEIKFSLIFNNYIIYVKNCDELNDLYARR